MTDKQIGTSTPATRVDEDDLASEVFEALHDANVMAKQLDWSEGEESHGQAESRWRWEVAYQIARRIVSAPTLNRARTKVMQRPNGCWAACISTLTGIPVGEFPSVPDDAREESWWDENGTRLRNEITAVLRKHGWRKDSTWTDIPRGFAMAYGTSPRGYEHAVVVHDGELWHDPHPEGGGLLNVSQYEILVPIIGKGSSTPAPTPTGREDGGGQ